MPRRDRIFLWAAPLIFLQWLGTALIEPNSGRGWLEYVSIGFFFGAFFGQTTLAAAWAALGPGPLRWRIPLSLVWVAMLPVAIAINVAIHGGPDGAAFVIAGCLFGQWLLVQLPLWALAIGYGLRLRHVDEGEETQDRRELQLGIRHLMVITTVVGVILGVGRISMNWLGAPFRLDPEAPIFIFLAVAAIALTLAAVTLRRTAGSSTWNRSGCAGPWRATRLSRRPPTGPR
jgi:hypothetical protein